MLLERIIVYAGEKSQTGKAVRAKFPNLDIQDSNESFNEIKKIIVEKPVLAMLPFWNSHGGEIKESHVAELIFQDSVKLYHLWPSKIIFECLAREGVDEKDVKKITSVFAAEPQCSDFIKTLGAEFKESKSTKVAFEVFKNSAEFDAVLVPPDQYSREGLKVIKNDAANKFNFTTFVLLGKILPEEWDGAAGQYLRTCCSPPITNIYGIEMPVPDTSISEDQLDLLARLTKDVVNINDIPRAIFVFEEEGGMCGILLESSKVCPLLISASEESIPQDILIRDNIGYAKQFYIEEISGFIGREFSEIIKLDFLKHIGTQTCLYACPPLSIFTHGFNPDIVEAVVRRMIDKYFELFINDIVSCSQDQKDFFLKYQQVYLEKGSRFIEFMQV